MTDKLGLFVCENYREEMRTVLASGEFEDLQWRVFPSRCGHPPLELDEVVRRLSSFQKKCDDICLLGCSCIHSISGSAAQSLYFSEVRETCFSFFLNKASVEYFIQDGCYLMTPGWLSKWKKHIKKWGFDQSTARTFFHEFARKLLLLDTGVDPNASDHLREMGAFLDLPVQVFPVGLDFFRMNLHTIIQTWRAEKERELAATTTADMNRKLADYAMMYTLLSKISAIKSEDDVIDRILELFTMLCAPAQLHYLPMVNGQPGPLHSTPPGDIDPQEMTRELLALETDDARTAPQQGFFLPISYGQQTVGILKIDQVTFPEYLPHYQNLAMSIAQVCGLAIANARKYQALENAREEISREKEKAVAARRDAESANRAKSVFLSNMSHELRTPLNAIMGFSQLLQLSPHFDPDERKSLSIILQSGEHLLSLINDVLDMSKIEAGRIELNEENVDLHRLLTDVEEMMALKARAKGLRLECEYRADVPRFVRTDSRKLRQVLLNLLSNALKFTTQGGISIRMRKRKTDPSEETRITLEFEVEDSGAGIASDELDSLFDAFVQTRTGRESLEGTGLGLPISRKFVRMMGGDMSVSSEPGQGTTVRFDIQVDVVGDMEQTPVQLARRVIGLAPDQPVYRILIVDDRETNRILLRKLLTMDGFELKEASNGQETINIWQEWEPHAILMDMRMPVMDGYEATKHIKATTKGQATAVIAVTASVFPDERSVVLSAGCDDFLRKPFRDSDLFNVLQKTLGVQFVHEAPDADDRPPERQNDAEITRMYNALQSLPSNLLAMLKKGAIDGDSERLYSAITNVRAYNSPLADALTRLTDNFEFETILSFMQKPDTGVLNR